MNANECPTCGSPRFDRTDLTDVERAMGRLAFGVEDDGDTYWDLLGVTGQAMYVSGLGTVTVVDRNSTIRQASYGYYDGVAYIVIKVGDLFFKNEASGDSYGTPEWNHGTVTEARKVTRTVEEWA